MLLSKPLTHNWIHTQCTSACGWRSCCASSLKSESPCSSFYWQVKKKTKKNFGWVQRIVKAAASALQRIEKNNFCGANKTPILSRIRKRSCPKSFMPSAVTSYGIGEAGSSDGVVQGKQIQEGQMQNNSNIQNSKTHQLHLTGARVRATISQTCWVYVCVYHIKPKIPTSSVQNPRTKVKMELAVQIWVPAIEICPFV